MENILDSHKEEFNKAINFLKNDIKGLRTSTVSPDLISNLLVDAYGKKMPLKSLSSISVSPPRGLVIEVWDKSVVKNIEKALSIADLGALPNVLEGTIHLNLPPLNEKRRNDLVRILKTKLEDSKNSLRAIRDKVREEIIKAEKNKDISEDDKYRYLENLDKFTTEKQEEINSIGERKIEEITTV